jgi:hypothetical protein
MPQCWKQCCVHMKIRAVEQNKQLRNRLSQKCSNDCQQRCKSTQWGKHCYSTNSIKEIDSHMQRNEAVFLS